MVENRCCSVQREGVYRWFSGLTSAQRAEFLCGLLDLCVPIELRFLGSCLEDLARKDYHTLRDAEIKANSPADLSSLTDITDEVVRSRLLISLALLSSDNRVAAQVLFRTITHFDSVSTNYGRLQLHGGQTEEQLLLLFTMASNHPAFSFHQKQVLREELTQIQEMMQVPCGDQLPGTGGLATLCSAECLPTYGTGPTLSCQPGCPCCQQTPTHQEVRTDPVNAGMPLLLCQDRPVKVHAGDSGNVNIERVELRGVTRREGKPREYMLEVTWSDSSVSAVSRTHQEVLDFLSQVAQLFPEESLEKFSPHSPGFNQNPELDPRCLTALPLHVLKHYQARLFFSTAPIHTTLSPPPAASLGCLLQYRGVNRAVCGVASIQPVMSVHNPVQSRSPTQLPPLPTLGAILPSDGVGVVGGGDSPVAGHLQNHGLPQQSSPEQNGILDWLRKLRLHKYYPVFKQLTMEEFLGLTEEDLNKYDLTQGAKKKLKTQLELQNREKMEKRFMLAQFPVSCSGIARVSPSSHIGPVAHAHAHSSCSTELRVEVETGVALLPRDNSFSSGYSSAPSSPMTPHSLSISRDGPFDKPRESHRRMESIIDPGEKDRACVLLNAAATTGPSRPTAQVLPVSPSRPCAVHYPSSSSSALPSSKSTFPSGSDVARGTASGVPMAAVPGQTYCLNSTASPSSSGSSSNSSGSSPGSFGSAPSSTACVCSSCGCSGGCGSYGALPASYTGYFPHPLSGTSVFTLGPLLRLSPLLPGSSTAPTFPYPLQAPPLYNGSVSHSHDTPGQQVLIRPHMQGFLGPGANVYQLHGPVGGGGHKKPGSLSCYNCGLLGHRAPECKQTPMDAAQQGTFKMRYAPKPDSDSGD
ncbi:hypothetical protein DPEC_G00216100 [Dallia pectoralis]|uniref:Uncharacterized protein n=1 Tax=Dallia pectoralis TaxID=75939 RepID=A0ACC2G2V7_DALPE|nr:hypothetical protein DPEC_G00216100 [Dallia pectoralis]